METFPALEFRDGPGGRRAALKSGPELWELIMVRRGYGDDLDGFRAHFDWVDPEEIDQALAYYDRFPQATDRFIAENERLARLLGDPSA